MARFSLQADFQPAGDQPEAIRRLVERFRAGSTCETLLGATGTGKTFTMANLIQALELPTLIISHNKTLAAQLYGEFKEFFPDNAVGYFVSYYDYYQPEAYVPSRDLYIAKDASINQDIDRLRLAATTRLMQRRDVVIVASVSCIYGIGQPEDYRSMFVSVEVGQEIARDDLLGRLVEIQHTRSDAELRRGSFRVRGDVVEVYPAYEEIAYRVDFFGDCIDRIVVVDPLTGRALEDTGAVAIFPARHFVTPEDRIERVVADIEAELIERLDELRRQGKTAEMQRLEARTRYDMELLSEVGFCPGIENYARHISGRKPGERPACLLDYFPEDFLTIVDESHQTVPQIRSMHHGDRSRKQTLVDYGFRLPSAMDNRPLTFDEWEQMAPRVLFVSATPERYEVHRSGGRVVDQIIRPTGLVDPVVDVRPARGQVQDVIREVRARAERGERTLVTTLTKRLAEDLSDFLREEGLNGCYLHSEVQTIERVEILNDLRRGKYDVIVGVNLLREGLDLPEVSLVAVLDADREGFLRSDTSLIQTMGRCARNVNAVVILYADRITESMARAMEETQRRREKQMAFNEAHGIVPQTIRKSIQPGIDSEVQAWKRRIETPVVAEETADYVTAHRLDELEKEMDEAAARLDFERAALLRDRLRALRGQS
ncbi:MAG: excinuclease ABC subunit UvrB [Candidatus Brocadiaceae bacterium]|nr:excinuclease ABC subunit UvrB [Candidatus Brocadiaceae bacterium]